MILLVVSCATAAALLFCAEMYRRDEPLLGLTALGVLMLAGLLGAVYATLEAG